MNKFRMALPLICVAPLLQSCASSPGAPQAWNISPLMNVRHAADTPEAFYQLGKYYQGQGRQELALEAFKKALAVDGRYAEAHNASGAIHAGKGRFDQAEEAFKAAIQSAPMQAHSHNNLGYAYFLQGKHAEAIAVFETAARLDPANQRTWNNLGMALARAGEPVRSRQAFARALELAAAGSPAAANVQPASQAAQTQLALPKDRGVITPLPVSGAQDAGMATVAQSAPLTAPDSEKQEQIVAKQLAQPLGAVQPGISTPDNVAQTQPEQQVANAVNRASSAQSGGAETAAADAAGMPLPSEAVAAAAMAPSASPAALAEPAQPVAIIESPVLVRSVPLVAQNEIRQLAPQVFELRELGTAQDSAAAARQPARSTGMLAAVAAEPRVSQNPADARLQASQPIQVQTARNAATSGRLMAATHRVYELHEQPQNQASAGERVVALQQNPVKTFSEVEAPASLISQRPVFRQMRSFRLELSNGNGITGMARRLGELLAAKGVPHAQLTNLKPFRQTQTEIQYREGFEVAAKALRRRLNAPAILVKVDQLRSNTDVRIVLGKDMPRTLALRDDLEAELQPVQVSAVLRPFGFEGV